MRRLLFIMCVAGLVVSVGLWCASLWRVVYVTTRTTTGVRSGAVFRVSGEQNGYAGWLMLGFKVENEFWLPISGELEGGQQFVVIPCWIPTVLFAIWPTFAFIRWFRHPRGGCPQCGYDIRATRDRCPECGILIPAKADEQ